MLLDGFSSWDCNADICGITGPCPACQKRERIEQILNAHGHQLQPCGVFCSKEHPCETCREVQDYLAYLFRTKNRVVTMMNILKLVAQHFPDEFRELLAPAVLDIVEEFKQ